MEGWVAEYFDNIVPGLLLIGIPLAVRWLWSRRPAALVAAAAETIDTKFSDELAAGLEDSRNDRAALKDKLVEKLDGVQRTVVEMDRKNTEQHAAVTGAIGQLSDALNTHKSVDHVALEGRLSNVEGRLGPQRT